MLRVKVFGSYRNFYEKLNNLSESTDLSFLEKYGQRMVDALRDATPVDTGKTAASWFYKIERKKNKKTGSDMVVFTVGNSNRVQNQNGKGSVPVVVLLDYGHATGNGGYVHGLHFIDPIVRPIFYKIMEEAKEEIKKACRT